MSRAPEMPVADQFDLFLPYIADLAMRDQREMMERPFFSLAKSKRARPIDYTSPDGKMWVHVSANADYGMATIWDADILTYCASVLADMARRRANDIRRKLHIMPYDLLRAIGRRQVESMNCWTGWWPRPSRPTSAPKTGVRQHSAGWMAERSWSMKRPSGRAA